MNRPFQNPLNPCQICVCKGSSALEDIQIMCLENPQCGNYTSTRNNICESKKQQAILFHIRYLNNKINYLFSVIPPDIVNIRKKFFYGLIYYHLSHME